MERLLFAIKWWTICLYLYHTVEMSGEYSSSRDTKKASYGNRAKRAATVLETHNNVHVHLHPYPFLLSL